jgi:hypothetical protein
MKWWVNTLFVVAWLLVPSRPAYAQVERVVVEAEGMSNACAPALEAALKSLESVYKYAISVQKQLFSVIYYRGERFQPRKLRWAADKGEAEAVRFHVSATGKIQQEGDQQFLVAGEDRFLIVSSTKLPTGVSIGVMGAVDDSAEPMRMRADDFKLLPDEGEKPF